LIIAIYSGGIPSTTFIENLIRGLAVSGHTVYLFGKQTAAVDYPANVKIYPTPASRAGLFFFILRESIFLLLNKRKQFMQALKLLRGQKSAWAFMQKAGFLFPVLHHEPDVFHIQWAKTIRQHPELFELLKCRFVLSLRGAHINYSPIVDKTLATVYRRYFPEVDGFHAVSQAIGKEAMKYGANGNTTRVIYSPVMENVLREFSQKEKIGSPLKIISIGRFHWKKGYDYALDAMKLLGEQGVAFEYTIVAQGKIPEEVLYHISDSGLGSSIKIINGLQHSKVIELVKAQDIFLLPSVEEGIANVALEAMAIGTPVISTDCGGMSEVITHRESGFIVPVRDSAAIAGAVREIMLLPPGKLQPIINAARKRIENNHVTTVQMQEFEELYRDVLKSA
jgi:glycosyltransferase involved in cell wall biosynthesis